MVHRIAIIISLFAGHDPAMSSLNGVILAMSIGFIWEVKQWATKTGHFEILDMVATGMGGGIVSFVFYIFV